MHLGDTTQQRYCACSFLNFIRFFARLVMHAYCGKLLSLSGVSDSDSK